MTRSDIEGYIAALIVAALVCLFVITPIVKSASADGRADFCYVEGHELKTAGYPYTDGNKRYWVLEAHRPWRFDMRVGYFASLDEVREAADKFGCKLHTEKP